MYIWEEGEDKWIWPADESVPRYVGTQISRDEIVNILNKSEVLQAEIDELKAEINRLHEIATKWCDTDDHDWEELMKLRGE